jgi:hypothetical protein
MFGVGVNEGQMVFRFLVGVLGLFWNADECGCFCKFLVGSFRLFLTTDVHR